jgi:uncharacterized integral membrane protein
MMTLTAIMLACMGQQDASCILSVAYKQLNPFIISEGNALTFELRHPLPGDVSILSAILTIPPGLTASGTTELLPVVCSYEGYPLDIKPGTSRQLLAPFQPLPFPRTLLFMSGNKRVDLTITYRTAEDDVLKSCHYPVDVYFVGDRLAVLFMGLLTFVTVKMCRIKIMERRQEPESGPIPVNTRRLKYVLWIGEAILLIIVLLFIYSYRSSHVYSSFGGFCDFRGGSVCGLAFALCGQPIWFLIKRLWPLKDLTTFFETKIYPMMD